MMELCLHRLRETDILLYLYVVYKMWYYEGSPLVSDTEFDRFETELRELYPENGLLHVVGAPVSTCKCCGPDRSKRKGTWNNPWTEKEIIDYHKRMRTWENGIHKR